MKKYCGILALALTIWLATSAPISVAISLSAKPLDDTVTFHAGWVIPLEDQADLTALESQTIQKKEIEAARRKEQREIDAYLAKVNKAQQSGFIAAFIVLIFGLVYLGSSRWHPSAITLWLKKNISPSFSQLPKLMRINTLWISSKASVASIETPSSQLAAQFGIFVVLVITGLLTLIYIPAQYFGLAKWGLYLLVPAPLLVQWVCPQWIARAQKILILLTLATTLYCITYISSYAGTQIPLYGLLITSCIAWASLNRGKRPFELVLMALVWFALSDLTNWQLLMGLFREAPILMSIKVSALLAFVLLFLIDFSKRALPAWTNGIWMMLMAPIILYFAFRSDALFIGGAAYHWEYFVGPLRAVRDGGWLLYDVPSQYGFLNLILASLIPTKSAWQAFYLFQSTLLAITAFLGLWTLLRLSQNTFVQKLGITLLFLCALFFADEHWIGPQPFPSSSVVRFFPCYLLIFCVAQTAHQKLRPLIIGIAWTFGVLWSAEGSLYSTIVTAAILIGELISTPKTERLKELSKTLGFMLIVLIASMALITAWYQIHLGHTPEWSSLYEYAIGYASGYGYVSFPLHGPGILLVLLILALGNLALISNKENGLKPMVPSFAAASAIIWSIGSYYLGRPMPQNITAIFPLLIFCTLVGLSMKARSNQTQSNSALRPIALPLFFLVLLPLISPHWYHTLKQSSSFSQDITQHLPPAEPELLNILQKLNPGMNLPMTYYGDAGTIKPFLDKAEHPNEKMWLPAPLQILGDPIPTIRRAHIFQRFLCRSPYKQGILIFQPGNFTTGITEFLSLLQAYAAISAQEVTEKFIVMKLERLPNSPCQNTFDIQFSNPSTREFLKFGWQDSHENWGGMV